MSPLDQVIGGLFVGIAAAVLAGIVVIIIAAALYDRMTSGPHKRRADRGAPSTTPAARATHHLCELRGHDYRLNAKGTYWVCLRGDDRVKRDLTADLPEIERYANGGVA